MSVCLVFAMQNMLALMVIGMGSFSIAESCSSDTLDGCPADYSELLQIKVNVSDLESESKAVGTGNVSQVTAASCDAWQSLAFCGKPRNRLEGGETGDQANCLQACKAAGSKCCAFKANSPLRCYGGSALTTLKKNKNNLAQWFAPLQPSQPPQQQPRRRQQRWQNSLLKSSSAL
mmetsp:Transcript_36678/g.67623  ORF Transcript_36678/g.67623 Transcript_36678/m.67623 type:complete len:175 (-) Transcript_36678:1196-1720(-)